MKRDLHFTLVLVDDGKAGGGGFRSLKPVNTCLSVMAQFGPWKQINN